MWKINDFSPLLGPFGVPCYVISKFWSFKVIKAKKAAPVHYGSFGQNLSKNTRDMLFDRIWIFLIPMALKGINKAIKIKKGQ